MNVIQAFQMLNQIKSNPMSLLSQRFNIPEGVNVSDPSAIINHLIQSGQVSQSVIENIKNSIGMH